MIRFENVSFKYPEKDYFILENLNLTIPSGELVLVVGKTGSGKSTFLGLINGLVPNFTGGELSGDVKVFDRSIKEFAPRDFADLVGVVKQDPRSSFVSDVVEDELAYGMEQLGISPSTMRRRVEEVLDLLSLSDLRNRSLSTLSGGQRQRVAIASVLTTNPKVLVLDEPTSALDPSAAEEVLAAIQRLVHDLGLTVILAEHRLERVVQYADRVIVIDQDAEVFADRPVNVFANSLIAPPVVELGRTVGWNPIPLTVRDGPTTVPLVVTTVIAPVVAPAGTFTVIVLFVLLIGVAVILLKNFTDVGLSKPVPLITIVLLIHAFVGV